MEIEYDEHPPHGWFPRKWDCVSLKQDVRSVEHRSSFSVTKLEVGVELTDSDFDVKFPPGTTVGDSFNFPGRRVVFTVPLEPEPKKDQPEK